MARHYFRVYALLVSLLLICFVTINLDKASIAIPQEDRCVLTASDLITSKSKAGPAGILTQIISRTINSDPEQMGGNTTSATASKCRVVPYTTVRPGDFHCTRLAVSPSPHICVYKNAKDDIWVSGAIHQGDVWETGNVRLVQAILRKDPELGVLDIGANVGQYSLIAAATGHRVVAVEALDNHVNMLHRAVIINGFQDNVTIVHNAVSDDHRTVSLVTHQGNMGSTHIQMEKKTKSTFYSAKQVPTIFMDDLLEVINFTRGFLKIDIEGHEPRAMTRCSKLFSKIYFPYILMEWSGSKQNAGSEEVRLVEELLRFMSDRGYSAYKPSGSTQLDPGKWREWPFDIFWQHSLVS